MDEAPKASRTAWKRWLSNVCYLTAIAAAMIGWLFAFGWVAVAFAHWLSD